MYIILCMCVCGIRQLIDCPSDKICRAVAIDCPLDASVPCIPRFVGHCVDPDGKASTAVSTASAAIRFLLLSRSDYLRNKNTLTYLLTYLLRYHRYRLQLNTNKFSRNGKALKTNVPRKLEGSENQRKKLYPS